MQTAVSKKLRYSVFWYSNSMSRLGKASRWSRFSVFYTLSFLLWFMSSFAAYGEPNTTSSETEVAENRSHLIEGVYYLMNQGDQNMAKEFFQKAIFSSPFVDLSMNRGVVTVSEPGDRRIVAEALYFLGKIHYEKVLSHKGEDMEKNIGLAKMYLNKAEEYGIAYDRLHPTLLDEIHRRYPGVGMVVPDTEGDGTKVTIEVDHGSYRVDTVKVDQHADVTEDRFMTNEEFALEGGARYKVEPDVQGGYRSIYRTLAFLGISLLVWLTRG